MVPLAHSAERWSVEPEVAGSNPVGHPNECEAAILLGVAALSFKPGSAVGKRPPRLAASHVSDPPPGPRLDRETACHR